VIGVVNYQTGNAQSVLFALHHLGLPARLVATPDEADDAGGIDRFILPGVGAADVTMGSLRERGWVDYLDRRVLGEGVPFLGVCVGLQVLFEHSAEGDVDCLGWLPGSVVRFESGSGGQRDGNRLRVPHMGWNVVRPTAGGSEHPFARALPPAANFYFVNSFHAVPAQEADVAGATDYGVEFASVVARGNVMATQFHIEKSGPVGLALLAAFAQLQPSELEQAAAC
jgi:imidazole glycerol-phosphate synthase subunit HisH